MKEKEFNLNVNTPNGGEGLQAICDARTALKIDLVDKNVEIKSVEITVRIVSHDYSENEA